MASCSNAVGANRLSRCADSLGERKLKAVLSLGGLKNRRKQ